MDGGGKADDKQLSHIFRWLEGKQVEKNIIGPPHESLCKEAGDAMYNKHFHFQFFLHHSVKKALTPLPAHKEMSWIINQCCQWDNDTAASCPTLRVFFNGFLCFSSSVPPVDRPGPLNQRPPHGSLPPSWLVQMSPKMPVGQWAVSLGVSPSLPYWSDWMKSEKRRRKIMSSIYYFFRGEGRGTPRSICSPHRYTPHPAFHYCYFFCFYYFVNFFVECLH